MGRLAVSVLSLGWGIDVYGQPFVQYITVCFLAQDVEVSTLDPDYVYVLDQLLAELKGYC